MVDAVKEADRCVKANLRAQDWDVDIGFAGGTIGILAESGVAAFMISNYPETIINTIIIMAVAVLGHVAHFGLCKLAEKYNVNILRKPGGLNDQYNAVNTH